MVKFIQLWSSGIECHFFGNGKVFLKCSLFLEKSVNFSSCTFCHSWLKFGFYWCLPHLHTSVLLFHILKFGCCQGFVNSLKITCMAIIYAKASLQLFGINWSWKYCLGGGSIIFKWYRQIPKPKRYLCQQNPILTRGVRLPNSVIT